KDLRQARLNGAIYQGRVNLAVPNVPKPERQELVPELAGFALVTRREVDRDILAQLSPASFFREAAALKRPVLEVPSRGHELWAKDRVGPRAEFPARNRLAAQHREATPVAVVQDLHDLSLLIRETEVAFVHNQCTSKFVEYAEQWRDGRCTARKDGLVAE